MAFSSMFQNLPACPPTPPKNTAKDVQEALDFLKDSFEVERATLNPTIPEIVADTPPSSSPPSSREPPATECRKRKKKVDFSPWNEYHRGARFFLSSPGPRHPLRQVNPPTRTKTPKSILKPFDRSLNLVSPSTDPNSTYIFAPHKYENLGGMLEAIAQALASEVRNQKRDGYIALLGMLKAYKELPEPEEWEAKMTLFAQFIKRDLSAQREDGRLDSEVVVQALKLLASFLYYAKLSDKLDDDFKVFVLERSIKAIEETTLPKGVINHHILVLSAQNFTSKILTPERVGRITTSIKDLNQRVTGQSVVGARLLVYKKLVTLSPIVMVSRMADWIENIFHGMLSAVKEIRLQAIDACSHTALSLGSRTGTSSQASQGIKKLFETEVEGHRNYGDFFISRLEDMRQLSKDASDVPLIWGAITIFFQNSSQVESFGHIKSWLTVIQSCLNSNTTEIRSNGHKAWNRFIFAVFPGMKTSSSLRDILRQPVTSRLRKKDKEKDLTTSRQMAYSNYYHLLYYTLRPSESVEHLDLFWDEYVAHVMGKLGKSSSRDAQSCCEILLQLFSLKNQPWSDRQMFQPPGITRRDLPGLPPRWIRQRLPKILPVVETCFRMVQWTDFSESTKDTHIFCKMWSAFLQAVADAGKTEITVSASGEQKSAITHFINLLHRLWLGSSYLQHAQLGFLVELTFEQLGYGNFGDKILLVKDNQAEVEVAPTPSHRTKKQSSLRSPLLHMIEAMLPGDDESLLRLIDQLITNCAEKRNTMTQRLELLQDCFIILARKQRNSVVSHSPSLVSLCNKCLVLAAAVFDETSGRSMDWQKDACQPAISLIVQAATLDIDPYGNPDLNITRRLLLRAAGQIDIHVVLESIIEPLSARLAVTLSSTYSVWAEAQARTILLFLCERDSLGSKGKPSLSRDRDQRSKKRLDLSSLQNTYTLLISLFQAAYQKSNDHLLSFVSAVTPDLRLFLQKLQPKTLVNVLTKLQKGFAIVVEDAEGRLLDSEAQNNDATIKARNQIHDLWVALLQLMDTIPEQTSSLHLDLLVSAGLRSRWTAVATTTIRWWNSKSSLLDNAELPKSIAEAVTCLAPIADIYVPGSLKGTGTVKAFGGDHYLDEPEDGVVTLRVPSRELHHRVAEFSTQATHDRHAVAGLAAESTAASGLSVKPMKACLRHNDSQVQFDVISSSPNHEQQIESQLLTDHQKEVRSRQEDGSVMFRDFASSPIRRSPRKAGRLTLTPLGKVRNVTILEPRSSTPSLDDQCIDEEDDAFVASSPLLRSSERRRSQTKIPISRQESPLPIVELANLDEPASSPPAADDEDTTMTEEVMYMTATAGHMPHVVSDAEKHETLDRMGLDVDKGVQQVSNAPDLASPNDRNDILVEDEGATNPNEPYKPKARANNDLIADIMQEGLRAQTTVIMANEMIDKPEEAEGETKALPVDVVRTPIFRMPDPLTDDEDEDEMFVDASQVPLPLSDDDTTTHTSIAQVPASQSVRSSFPALNTEGAGSTAGDTTRVDDSFATRSKMSDQTDGPAAASSESELTPLDSNFSDVDPLSKGQQDRQPRSETDVSIKGQQHRESAPPRKSKRLLGEGTEDFKMNEEKSAEAEPLSKRKKSSKEPAFRSEPKKSVEKVSAPHARARGIAQLSSHNRDGGDEEETVIRVRRPSLVQPAAAPSSPEPSPRKRKRSRGRPKKSQRAANQPHSSSRASTPAPSKVLGKRARPAKLEPETDQLIAPTERPSKRARTLTPNLSKSNGPSTPERLRPNENAESPIVRVTPRDMKDPGSADASTFNSPGSRSGSAATPAVEGETIAEPDAPASQSSSPSRSFLARIMGMAAEIKMKVFGRDQELELTRAVFALGHEISEAGRRGSKPSV